MAVPPNKCTELNIFKMSLNKEKDEGYPGQLAIPRKIQDELVHIIQMSLNNIAIQVNNLSKYAEDIFGEISKEVDKISFRLNVLQERVIQLTNGITCEDPKEDLSLQIMKSRTFQSITIQTQQVYSSKPLPVKIYERHDACVQTVPLNMSTSSCQDDTGLKISPDASYCFELYKEKVLPESKEEKKDNLKQKMHEDHPNKPESVLQSQWMEDNISVDHVPLSCSEVSHSYADQPDESSLSSSPLCEISKLVTTTIGKVLSSSLHVPMREAGDVKKSFTYVNYGTGMGEELQPQPRNCLKSEVFVSPTAPNSPPPLPPDWLTLLRASKRETLPPIMHFPTQLPSPVLRTPATTSPTACLPTTPEAALPITSPKVDFFPPVPEPFQYHELTTDDLLPQDEYQEMPPSLSPSPIPSPSIQTRVTVTDLVGSASFAQSSTSLVFPYATSSFVQSPRASVAKSSRSSPSPPPNYFISPPRYSIPQFPRSSTPQTPQNSVPLSLIASCPQTPRALILSPTHSFSQSPRNSVTILSRCLDAQSLRPSGVQSQSSSVAQSTRHLIPSQPRSSSLKSPRSSTLQSLFSFVRPPSCISSPWALSVSKSSPAPVNTTLKQPRSNLPIIIKTRNALMEAIRKVVLLHKTED
ncbi:hypothetical protein mRhiFer1_007917 [Rhinolophus ferrumequinum]|uniref:Wiskott-Aldrich syndrome protein family member n=1 Tax=Rhinolophus ferrumequinum TaxID=59479 RepID=A0A7J8AUS3_RHIFE|nr:hypothetical protein mRhiFer1_007917 [Rhinolophus ferrumequinum]